VVITQEPTVVPEIPALDSSQRLPDDPPPTYKPPTEEIVRPSAVSVRDKAQKIYLSQVGVRELTGNNDGKEVLMYQKAAGLGKGFSWCSCFVKWCFDSAKVKTTINAWSPTAHNPDNLVFFSRRRIKDPAAADVFTIWFASKKRIAHTGFVNKEINSGVVETVEGNTSEAGSREGDGVYKRKRSTNSLYSITRWIKD